MYKIFDFECKSCQYRLENVMIEDNESVKCHSCHKNMTQYVKNA